MNSDSTFQDSEEVKKFHILKSHPCVEEGRSTSLNGTSGFEVVTTKADRKLMNSSDGMGQVHHTIAVGLAIFVAAATIALGLNPPGSFHQDGTFEGKAIKGMTTIFKLFMCCNNIAFFLSLVIIFSIIRNTFNPEVLSILLVIDVSSLGLTYVTGIMVITPNHDDAVTRVLQPLSMVFTFCVCLGVSHGFHYLISKKEGRQVNDESTNMNGEFQEDNVNETLVAHAESCTDIENSCCE